MGASPRYRLAGVLARFKNMFARQPGIVRTALENGIFTFDTADVYANGAAEKVLGRALRDVDRQDLVLMSKVYWPVKGFGPNDAGLVPQ